MIAIEALSLSESLEQYLEDSLPQGEREFYDRAVRLNLKYCEFEQDDPVSVFREPVSGGVHSFRVTITVNVSTMDGKTPNRAIEAIDDWIDDRIYAWVSAQNSANIGTDLPELTRHHEPRRYGSAPTWKVKLQRHFTL